MCTSFHGCEPFKNLNALNIPIASINKSCERSGALSEPAKKQATVPAIYIVKYNKFVDTILDKMNDVLRQSYDPVSVKLQPIDASKKGNKPKKNKNKSKRKSSNKKKNTARGEIKQTSTEVPEKTKEQNLQVNEVMPESAVKLIENASESRALDPAATSKAKPTTIKTKPPTKTPKPPTKQTKPKPKPTKSTTKKPTTTKNKTKTSEKSKPRAKGTLYGLSSLKRTGDVTVNIMSNHTTVKSNFAVRVDSNHERTRELVWRRSARIAHVVSEKLLSASKPMFYHQAVVKQ
ncbi:putative ubiquitin-protein ligase/hyperplastic discs protein [Operophtera brumata]|uniref:Putative ubiquitin-protein ligase/hyperplastic discs protein n=1 Tax=Operophtera brumata TaxID=104452 RepID=A0A0L7LJQ1_OPEBR|nr:putative ubiquitin-protein ligase/hyperplastic discs protein [Operophtera brumata]